MFRTSAPRLTRPLLSTSIRNRYRYRTPSGSSRGSQAPANLDSFVVLPRRTFTAATPVHKKASGGFSKGGKDVTAATAPSTTGSGAFDYAEHFKGLEEETVEITARLKDELSKLRGGRADPGVFEALEVVLDKGSTEKSLLKDVAHVVPKGRALAITVYEAANVKKVITAIQRADMNVQPMIDPKNPQLLNVPLPPPTKESRLQTVALAGKAGEKALNQLRLARQGSHKKIKGLKGERPDDIRKADKQLEKIIEKANAEAKKIIEAGKKAVMEA
ncbi:ribosome-recycling factor [Rhizina undulata]